MKTKISKYEKLLNKAEEIDLENKILCDHIEKQDSKLKKIEIRDYSEIKKKLSTEENGKSINDYKKIKIMSKRRNTFDKKFIRELRDLYPQLYATSVIYGRIIDQVRYALDNNPAKDKEQDEY